MLGYAFYQFLLLRVFLITSTISGAVPAATDFILLNCGAQSNLNDTSNRSWDSDERLRYKPPNAADISSTHKAAYMDPYVPDQVPYETARVFRSPFIYTFPVSTGPKFLRLYFYPTTMYSGYNASLCFFSVTANGFTLLSNFSAFLNSPQPNHAYMKEFVVNVAEEQRLNVTFSPNTDSFAFVNGIEIVSIPDDLYYRGMPIKFTSQVHRLENDTALETLYRLNVGGNDVAIQEDSGGMFRAWAQDNPYIFNADYSYGPHDLPYIFGTDFGYTPHDVNLQIKYTRETPPYSAPPIVYTTSRVMANFSRSLEWYLPVDSGFYYLLRLHFCEIQHEVTEKNQTIFTISINNQTAESQADVIAWTNGTGIPIFRDYGSLVPDDGRRGKKDLRLSLFPNLGSMSKYKSALLNGLEIFKLSDSIQSLAAANLDPPVDDSSPPATALNPPRDNKSGVLFYAVIGSVSGVLAAVAAVFSFLFLRWLRQKLKDSINADANSSGITISTSSISTTTTSLPLLSDLCRRFSLKEMNTATGNFDDQFIIGRGGFGNVYKGFINDGAATAAIKRLNPSSSQGISEFLTEIQMLSKLRQTHLVSLIGYCDENGEMILVYDYMEHGTLRDHLCDSENTPLTWKQRLQICIGAAKGLNYLHSGTDNAVIHRDVKSTNILLDENWVAKISDFGLCKMGAVNDSFTHITTNIKGTYGYLDPEYFSSHKLTRKSDVYAFGVVLFEVLSGRPAVDVTLEEEEQHSLAVWARYCIREGKLDRLIDPNLAGQISPACLQVFAEIAGRCLLVRPHGRPAMADVVMGLELASSRQSDDPTECSNNLEHYF